MKKTILVLCWCYLLLFSSFSSSEVIIRADNILLSTAFQSVSQDLKLQLVNEVRPSINKQVISQNLRGNSYDILDKLSQIYNFSWYSYGGTLVIQSDVDFVNFTYKPTNIGAKELIEEIVSTFKASGDVKIQLSNNKDYLFFSGPSRFIRDISSYAQLVNNNYFLENNNALEVATIYFDYLSVVDRDVESYNGSVSFLGAANIIDAALSNIGQFQNASSEDILKKSYKIKLDNGNKPQLEEDEKTSKVMPLVGVNAVLVRGTTSEVAFAKRIARIIDVKNKQILYTLRVYDVAVEQVDSLGIDPSLLNGSSTLYDFLSLPFISSQSFAQVYQAISNTGMIRSVYQTHLISLENQRSHFGKKETATITVVSSEQIDVQKIEADNSLYVTGRLLPNGQVLAKVDYVEETLGNDGTDVNTNQPPTVSSQSLSSEVYITSNQTVVLGGFDVTVTESAETGIPLLSDIPFIGILFKNTNEIKRKYKRYISISFEVIE